ncbi:baculoviral IAP repeat-containing protein 5.2 [Tribolium castaneum]|uniref:Apoptosis 2 inhibitor-like Protein n=1 Tax=Tribolium castaneum TaxID=7070 RepID=D6WDU5_TRICA|nr:PREDICTED: baculoviral IAP repeat-containing protein 5.2 [Tribolium castaneum]EFA01269.1 Apoptosis 2 inhibitor-like Protein [Tribolium castaneum]|eukprot:XP_001807705.1 PREDICTED: baculoviral IAP repeat-containing protein 5.2 [Tribolium castaneum]
MTQNLCDVLQTNLEYCFEANRKSTFKKWVFSDKVMCNAAKLAEAGFIFVGNSLEPDSVKCFLCNKSLDCWAEDDDPWTEHIKHSPKCSFAKKNKPEKSLTLSEFIDFRNELIERVVDRALQESLEDVKGQVDDILQMMSALK